MKLSLRSLLYDLVFNEDCPICSRNSHFRYSPFCETCWRKIESFSSHRIYSGKFHSEFWKYVDSLSSFGAYEGILKEAIHYFKYVGIKRFGKELGKLFISIKPPEVDLLIPVPLHISKLRKRGFNQSATLAKEYADTWRIPLSLTSLIKVRDTKDQASLEAKERWINVRDAYLAKNLKKGIKVGLVDDVVTTGATIMECAKALKKAGVREIHAITLARTI
ncbi:MAG: ComF family protein [Thermodesulfovibrio sp.]|nr:ComF family protein [Thermodesulfovibrio sp.]